MITPNIPEAQVPSGITIQTKEDMATAGIVLYRRGARAVLVKGGHLAGCADDVLVLSEDEVTWFGEKHVKAQNTHGTGCTLSLAIAA